MQLAKKFNTKAFNFDSVENIAHFDFSSNSISIDEFKEVEEIIFTEQNQNKFFSMIEVSDYMKLNGDLKEYLISEDRSWKVQAEAILTKSFTKKLLIDLYFQLNLPLVPTKTFTQNNDARSWLNSVRRSALNGI